MKTQLNKMASVVKAKAGKTVIRRSDDYLDRIEDLKIDMLSTVIRAKVSNGKGDTYNVKWDLENRQVSGSCPAHQNRKTLPCKHAVAVFRNVYHEFN